MNFALSLKDCFCFRPFQKGQGLLRELAYSVNFCTLETFSTKPLESQNLLKFYPRSSSLLKSDEFVSRHLCEGKGADKRELFARILKDS